MAVSEQRRVRYAFGRAARHYSRQAVLQREVSQRLLERLACVRVNPVRILDIGAGTGNVTKEMLRVYGGAYVYALDFAPEMLREFYSGVSWLQKRRSALVCAEAGRLPFSDASFDLVVSSLTFQWCLDLPRVLAEVERVLRPEGLLLFATLGPDTLRELRDSWAAADAFEHVNRFVDLRDVGDMLLASGLADPVTDIDRIIMTYPDVASLMRDLKAIGANTVQGERAKGLTGKQRFRSMQQNYERLRMGDTLPATYEVVYGHGWKSAQPMSKLGSQEIRVPLSQLKRAIGNKD